MSPISPRGPGPRQDERWTTVAQGKSGTCAARAAGEQFEELLVAEPVLAGEVPLDGRRQVQPAGPRPRRVRVGPDEPQPRRGRGRLGLGRVGVHFHLSERSLAGLLVRPGPFGLSPMVLATRMSAP